MRKKYVIQIVLNCCVLRFINQTGYTSKLTPHRILNRVKRINDYLHSMYLYISICVNVLDSCIPTCISENSEYKVHCITSTLY